MRLTLAADTALHILRFTRLHWKRQPARTELHDPDPSPRKRWSASLLDLSRFGIEGPFGEENRLVVCLRDQHKRLRTKGVRNLVHAEALPDGACLDLGGGIFSSGPELLFVEYAAEHTLAETCMLGMELCGSFARDPDDPLDGHVTMGRLPLTTREKLETFVAGCRGVTGLGTARKALRCIADNAWSPMEAAVAVMMMLPLEEYGYGLGRCSLNVRVATPNPVRGATGKAARVPDILIDDTPVGVNYDGYVHLDLDSIAQAGAGLGRDPNPRTEWLVQKASDAVRAKAVDDLRRNRDLAASGFTVLPVVKEDLYVRGGLDGIIWQLLAILERRTKRRHPQLRHALELSFASEERYRLLRSMIPRRDASLEEALATSDVFIKFNTRP